MRKSWTCLEFTKTVGWEQRDKQTDDLDSYPALVEWAEADGCLDALTARELRTEAASRPSDAERALRDAKAARALIYRIFRRIGDGHGAGSAEIEALNLYVRDASVRRRLAWQGSRGGWEWRWDDDRLDIILTKIVWSAAELLTSPECERVKHCASDGCGWLFIDGSRNHSRRWCDMTDCGNLEKARRFRQRHR